VLRWRPVAAFPVSHTYPPGEGPRDHHPARWGKLEVHRFGRVHDPSGKPVCTVAVHSTRRSRDGWSYNVVELASEPKWAGYFHHGPTGQRIMHRGSHAPELEQAFDLHHLM
jgi:hypothetical protein